MCVVCPPRLLANWVIEVGTIWERVARRELVDLKQTE